MFWNSKNLKNKDFSVTFRGIGTAIKAKHKFEMHLVQFLKHKLALLEVRNDTADKKC